jgi:glycosyltransferase involved in cell wall biosynthesis
MKILIIGSTSRSLINFRGKMLQAFVEKGHDVHAIAPEEDAEVVKTLKSWGIEFHRAFVDRTGKSPFRDFRSLFSLFRVIKSIKPDIVLTYTVKPVVYGSLAARLAGVPKIYSMITGLGTLFINTSGLKNKVLHNYGKSLYRLAGKVNQGFIFQNPDDKELFINENLIPEKKAFQINGSGVDLEYFIYSQPPVEPVRFLFIGRFLKEKGVLEFIEAANILNKAFPDVRFDVVGRMQPNTNRQLEKTIYVSKEKGLINFLGIFNDIRIPIRDSSVFVLPSYREGTPRTGLECLAMGRPLIMTNVPGCRETVIDGQNGFLVPKKNPTVLAEAMEIFIRNPMLIKEMGAKSRQLAIEKFDVNKVNAALINILKL